MSAQAAREALGALLAAQPGAHIDHYVPPRAAAPLSALYKVMGKLFAIMSLRGDAYVILKCDLFEADLLRERYEGVGHRSHLDKRFWISVDLTADVPAGEIARLAERSYALVRAGLTRKQQAALAALADS
ncbi:MAG: hypothetical protein BGP16_05835 [Sphingobium sp. 66-54]|nr:MAG: hypothetical protein BGP16_05835 [Sphingobium sp. 66-54]